MGIRLLGHGSQLRDLSFGNAQIGMASFRASAAPPRHMRVDGRVREITFHYVCSPLIEKGSEGLRHIPVVR